MPRKKQFLALSVRAHMPVRAILESLVLDHNCTGIEEMENGFLACFPEGTEETELAYIMKMAEERCIASGFRGNYDISIQRIPHKDWSVHWKDRFNPVEVGEKLIIMAPWHNVVTDRIPVIIEPSMAFGTGDHPTTRLCLEAIERLAHSRHMASLLDVGTGTGILAIAAAKLGFARIAAIDNDPVAIETARENIRRNNTENIVVSSDSVNNISGNFDVIVANLTSETIKELYNDIAGRLRPGGICIFSGILDEQRDDMTAFFRDSGIQHLESSERGGWCRIVIARSTSQVER
jgi:ribosomal protein L11 methyltransferase